MKSRENSITLESRRPPLSSLEFNHASKLGRGIVLPAPLRSSPAIKRWRNTGRPAFVPILAAEQDQRRLLKFNKR